MKILTSILALITLASSGCTSAPIVPSGIEVMIKADHAHSRYCGHYVHDSRWYYLRNHKHGVGCGHEISDAQGAWVIEE